MTTIGFVIPLKSKSVSKNWELEVALLNRTLQSVCNQTNQQFKVYVIYNQKPEIAFKHQNINYVEFPYKYVTIDEISDYDTFGKKYYHPAFAVGIMDKIRKVAYGCEKAKIDNCKYLMVVDSDDLISSNLVSFINNNVSKNPPGWFIDKGYIYKEGSSIMVRQSKNMQLLNGSTHIVRSDFFVVPNFNNLAMWPYSFFEAHGYIVTRIKDNFKENLQPLPFYGVVYVVHKNNWSRIGSLAKIDNLKKIVKQIFYFQWLTQSLKKEFGIYHFI